MCRSSTSPMKARQSSNRPRKLVAGRCQNASLDWSLPVDLLQFPAFNQRNIGGNHQCALFPALHRDASGHFDGAGFPRIIGIRNHLKAIFESQFRGIRIACDDANWGPILPPLESRQHVGQHRLSELCSGGLIQDCSQTLLCPGGVLDRYQDHGWRSRRRNEVSETGSSDNKSEVA